VVSGLAERAAVGGSAVNAASDEALIARLAAGVDEPALSELYDRYQALMYGLALRITRDTAMAQDAVQEAFIGVWRNASKYSASKASVRTWILSITHHRAIDLIRRRRATAAIPEDDAPGDAFTTPDVWPDVVRAVDAAAVRVALGALPDLQRRAIEMAYFDGLTQTEIADKTGAPLGTVKSRVRLGLIQLRRELEGVT
jgi:RNA polymerase sigma-70 factor, ECF subfamily